MKNNYSQKLRDPRWQKKRLEVFNRDLFTCTLCGDKESTLAVHHKEYNGEPWEVSVDKLITVCEHCHQVVETEKSNHPFGGYCIPGSILKLKSKVDEGFYMLHLFDQSGYITAYKIDNGILTYSYSYNGSALKKVVHFIINYWLQNDLEHNLQSKTPTPNEILSA